MDLRALKHRPVSIYLAPNITDITLLKPLLALFVQQTLDTLLLEQAGRTVPVYFLLDEFRQLKKMSEITTKLPYVAGYNIKIAFIIQDLKNLDEIYGETSRHSLMGNCGYQLVFGANDQVTAETVSKGLGKRTVRYKTESRTIELMGLHRRTKVEQLRERDLMMPQEIRQMPPSKMVIVAEGQGPILADKLRFFATSPFDRMEAFSRANVPDVPAVEFLPATMVPATTEGYARSGNREDEKLNDQVGLSQAVGSSDEKREPAVIPTGKAPPLERSSPNPPPSSERATLSLRALKVPDSSGFLAQSEQQQAGGRRSAEDVVASFAVAARKLKVLVRRKSKSPAASSLKDWSAVFEETVPDQKELEFELDGRA